MEKETFIPKELWGYEKISVEIEEGIAWKNICGDNSELWVPLVEAEKKDAEKENKILAQQRKMEREKEEKERKIQEEEQNKTKEKEEKIKEEKQKRTADEKKQWIEKNGSERLKAAIAEGYEAKKQYILERAIHELGK
ncbi:MAG: hypothetical protein AB1472_03240, partial [Candidatus Omnitrophota bacterium]